MTSYRERLSVPPSWWIAAVAFSGACAWIVLVATTRVAAAVAFAAVLAGIGTLVGRYGTATIVRDDSGLHVGRAHLDAAHLGRAEALHRDEYRRRLGVGADARAYLVTRPYLDRGVLVHVADATDPVPYWLVSSRHPDAVAAAINDHPTRQESIRGQEA